MLLLIVAAPSLHAQNASSPGQTGTHFSAVEGAVFDANTQSPIAGAQVRINEIPGMTAITDAAGQFSIPVIPIEGEYQLVTITVHAAGYGRWTMPDAALFAGVTRIMSSIELTGTNRLVDGGGLPLPLRDPDEEDILAILAALPDFDDVLDPSFFSHDVIPPTIKVGITGFLHCRDWLNAGQPVNRIDEMPFSDYVKNVLGNEWVSTWNMESLRAGAMAVKMFAWWRINLGGVRPGGAHVVDNTCDQVYRANSAQSRTSAAVDDTWNHIMRSNNRVVEIHYLNTDANCTIYFPNVRCMGQWGSKAHADAGRDWQWILHHYYDPVTITLGSSNLPAMPANENIIRNGGFSDSTANWVRFGEVTWAVNSGVLALRRPAGQASQGGISQNLPYITSSGAVLEVVLQLGNSSDVTKEPNILVRDTIGSFSCRFSIPPNTPLRHYIIRGRAGNWSSPRLEIWPDPADGIPDLLVDNVEMYYRPGLQTQTTQCLSPSGSTDWDFSGGSQSWMIAGGLTNPDLNPNGGTWYNITGTSPMLDSLELTGINAANYDYIAVQMASQVEACARVYFQREGQTDFTNTQRMSFTIYPDGNLHTYYVPINENLLWDGNITRLRLEPACDAGSGKVRVGRVALTTLEATPVLLAPTINPTNGYGNPIYSWTHISGATHYQLYVGTAQSQEIFYETLPAANYCGAHTCQIDPTQLGEAYRLSNGDYVVYLQAWKGSSAVPWVGPFAFTLNAPSPSVVTLKDITGTETSRPVFGWSLEGTAANASWFRLYVAPRDDLGSPMFDEWFTRVQACGSPSSTNCAVQSPVDLWNDRYSLYVQSWGPGGFSVGGFQGWAGAQNFTIEAPTPATPGNIVASSSGSTLTITWDDDISTAWYEIYIGTGDGVASYLNWHQKTPGLCNGGACALTPNVDLANGSYQVYIRAWGAGGFSEGDLEGWGGPAHFSVLVNAPSAIVPLTPTGANSGRPLLQWRAAERATWYQLWIGTSDQLEEQHARWYRAAAVGCALTEICSVMPDVQLPDGNFVWYVLGWGPGGFSAGDTQGWAQGAAFSVNAHRPSWPLPLSPTGAVNTPNPAYMWVHIPDATWYQIRVDTIPLQESPKYAQWHPADALNCYDDLLCTLVVPGIYLIDGSYEWSLQAYNSAGVGGWSAPQGFLILR